MREAVFIRVHDAAPDQKATTLRKRTAHFRERIAGPEIFRLPISVFASVPGSPFAYWIRPVLRQLFANHDELREQAFFAQTGASTKNDTRYIRAWWEVPAFAIGHNRQDTYAGQRWISFAKGGRYSPFYADVELVVDWLADGVIMKTAIVQYRMAHGWGSQWSAEISGHSFYFRRGLTWPRRTTSPFSVRRLPDGCIFGEKGPTLFSSGDDAEELGAVQSLLQSELIKRLIETMLAAATAAARSYEVGIVQQLPLPPVGELLHLHSLSDQAFGTQRVGDTFDETTHAAVLPALLLAEGQAGLLAVNEEWNDAEVQRKDSLNQLQHSIDEAVFDVFAIPVEERAALWSEVSLSITEVDDETEVPDAVESDEDDWGSEDLSTRAANLLMWCVGVAFGRWDVRMARDRSLIPALQGPFERLPRVAPGGLVGPDGLPATEDRIASEEWLRARPDVITLPEPGSFKGPDAITAAEYPVEVAWDGILVDDEGHPKDIVARVRQVLAYVYGERAGAIEDEALQILRGDGKTPRTLRDWLRTQKAAALGKSFYDFHIQRYSKSRRKAPLYWRLTGDPRGGGRYAVWTYFHRLTGDSLYRLLADYLGPRIRLEEARQAELRREREGKSGREGQEIESALEESAELLEELAALERDVRAAAERGWRPEPDDGIILNLAPLHALTPWKEPEAAWKKLEKGEYDWARAAMRYWPARVTEKCATDRSLAIAHGLDQEPEEVA